MKANFSRNFLDFSGPYGPLWAHVGPARALEEREKFRKNALFFRAAFLSTDVVFYLQTAFFDCFNVFFRFLAEIA